MQHNKLYPSAQMLGAGYITARQQVLAKSGLDPGTAARLLERVTRPNIPDEIINDYAEMAADMLLYMSKAPITPIVVNEGNLVAVYYTFQPALLENRLVGKTALTSCYCRLAMDYPDQVLGENVYSFDGGLVLLLPADQLLPAHLETRASAKNACLASWISVRFDPEARERFEAELNVGSLVTARGKFGGLDTLVPAVATHKQVKSMRVQLTADGRHYRAGQALTLPLSTAASWTLHNSIWPIFPIDNGGI